MVTRVVGLDKRQLLDPHHRRTDEHLGILNLDLACLTEERQVAHPAPLEPMNAPASPDPGSNRLDPLDHAGKKCARFRTLRRAQPAR
ncbi:MAG: hypothetical protein MZW92_60835 [Comamonadaceae bacterium]|nr:hypothetical protein [Comamonadaceae bacterium]